MRYQYLFFCLITLVPELAYSGTSINNIVCSSTTEIKLNGIKTNLMIKGLIIENKENKYLEEITFNTDELSVSISFWHRASNEIETIDGKYMIVIAYDGHQNRILAIYPQKTQVQVVDITKRMSMLNIKGRDVMRVRELIIKDNTLHVKAHYMIDPEKSDTSEYDKYYKIDVNKIIYCFREGGNFVLTDSDDLSDDDIINKVYN